MRQKLCVCQKRRGLQFVSSPTYFSSFIKKYINKKCLPFSILFHSCAQEGLLALTFHYKFHYSLIFIISQYHRRYFSFQFPIIIFLRISQINNLPMLKPYLFGMVLIAITVAVNIRSFSTVIQTGSVNIFGGVNGTISQTVTFSSAKANTGYNYAFTVERIQLRWKSTKIYSNVIQISSLSASQMVLLLSSSQINSVKALKIMYLIIQSTFTSYINTVNFYQQYATPIQLNSVNGFFQSVSLVSAMTTAPVIMAFINSWELKESSTKRMSIYTEPTLSASSNVVDVKITNTLPSTTYCELKIIGFVVVAYDVNYFKFNYNNQFFDNGRSNAISSSNNSIYTFALPIKATAYFIGHFGYYVDNNGDIDYDFNFVASNVHVNIKFPPSSSYSQILSFSYIQFQTIPNCALPTTWNQANNQCQNCNSGYFYDATLATPACVLCNSTMNYCLDCTSKTVCTSCAYSLTPSGSTCSPICSDVNCVSCLFSVGTGIYCNSCSSGYIVNSSNTLQCIPCASNTYYSSSPASCIACSSLNTYCLTCSNSATCTSCDYTLTVSGNTCTPTCSDLNCVSCLFSISRGIYCNSCSSGYIVNPLNQLQCIPNCGDGILTGTETCDDGNMQNGDGCSAQCTIQDYFNCNTISGSPSQCFLIALDVSPFCIIKNEGSNAFTLTLDLKPKGLFLYSMIDWKLGFPSSTVTSVQEANYDSADSRLRVVFEYFSSIQDLTNLVAMSPSVVSTLLSNIADTTLLLPQNTQNNQALIFYEDSHYAVAKAVKYLAYTITALVCLLFFVGYFGAKLVALECLAVIQLSGMLLFSLKNMNPTMAALKPLSLSLGLIPLVKGYKYEISSLSPHYKYLFLTNGLLDGQNIFLLLVFVPMLAALIVKLLSDYKYKDKPLFKLAWKNCLGTFTFYGILMLAYGQFSYLAVNAKQFFSETDNFVTLSITVLFTLLVFVYIFGFCKYPRWFGSFKNKFVSFSICEYFYVFSTFERILTPTLIVALSPFKFASLVVCPIFIAEAVFIAYKKPYILNGWKRPFANKVLAALICVLFACAAATENQESVQKAMPIVIESIQLLMVCYSGYFAIKQYPKNFEEIKLKAQNAAIAMQLEDCQKKQLQDFAVKMLPQELLKGEYQVTQPNKIQQSNFKWYWQNYARLYSISILSNLNTLNTNLISSETKRDVELKEVATIGPI